MASSDPEGLISVLTISTLFPNAIQPAHGIFVETRLRELISGGGIQSHVLAPVAWMPPLVSYRAHEGLRQIPPMEMRNGIQVDHPRYLVIPKLGMNLAPYSLYLTMRKRLKILRAAGQRFDLIDAHYFYPDGVAAAWLGKEFHLPVIITARGTDINLIPEYPYPRRLILKAAKSAAALITVCQALKDRLVELGAPREKITVLRNGVDLDKYQMLDRNRLRKKWSVYGFTFASVGLLVERKGHQFAIEALLDVPDANLLIAGDGPDRAILEKLAKDLHVSHRVRFLGRLDSTSLCEVYNCADALVLASSREGWANVLLESMACGTRVVATSIWGTPEVVRGPQAGILIDSRSGEAVAQGINNLRAMPINRIATRHYAEQFSWDATTDGQVKIFKSAIAREH